MLTGDNRRQYAGRKRSAPELSLLDDAPPFCVVYTALCCSPTAAAAAAAAFSEILSFFEQARTAVLRRDSRTGTRLPVPWMLERMIDVASDIPVLAVAAD